MQRFEHDGRQAVFDLVYSGVGKQIQPGDTIGVWNFGQEAHGGIFPMQVWDPDQNLQLASVVGLFLKNQRYDNSARLETVIPRLLGLIRTVQDVNILVVSGTEPAWKGTPFDAEINAAFQQKSPQALILKQPLITTLAAQNGAIVSWSVTLPGEPILLPKMAEPQPVVQASPTPAAKSPASIEIAKPASPAPKRIFITSKPPSTDTEAGPNDVQVVVSNRIKPADVELANPSPPQVVGAERSETVTISNTNNGPAMLAKSRAETLSASKGVASVVKSDTEVRPSSVARILPGLPVAARETPATDPPSTLPQAPLAIVNPPGGSFLASGGLLASGAALGVFALGLLYFAARLFRPAAKPSFITRSLEQESS